MKVTRLAILGVAVVAAGGAAMMASRMASRSPEVMVEAAPQPVELTEVLIAASDIGLGNKLNADMVRWQKWPDEGLAEGYITRRSASDNSQMDDVVGAIARASFFTGEPIRRSKLVVSDRGYMSAILPAGQRAIATNISTETSAGGFILPNDRVDVIMTRLDPNAEEQTYLTETILENVRVLAIDQTIEEQDGEAVVVGETATLQLTPRQTEILTVAQQMADRLALSLRSLADSGEDATQGADHLLSGIGAGRVRMIRYGKTKTVNTGQ